MEQILTKAGELGALLENSQIVNRQKAAKKAFDADEELQALIGEFNLAKMSLMNESNKEKPDAEKTEQFRAQTTATYEKIMQHPTMIELNEAEMALENLLGQINAILQKSISDDAGGCTHNCATCGGCH